MATMKATQNGSTLHGGGQATGKHVSGKVKGREAEADKEKLDKRNHPRQFDPNAEDDQGQAG